MRLITWTQPLHAYIVMLFILVSIDALSQNNSLYGKWVVDIDKSVSIMDVAAKSRFDSLSDEIRGRALSRMNNREFHFASDGNVSVKWQSQQGDRISNGTWEMDSANGLVAFQIDGQRVEYSFSFQSPDEFIMRSSINTGFFNNLFLRRIN